MNKLIIIAVALIILAGAFPTEAYAVIAWASALLSQITGMVTPGQQTAIIIIAVLFGLAALAK